VKRCQGAIKANIKRSVCPAAILAQTRGRGLPQHLAQSVGPGVVSLGEGAGDAHISVFRFVGRGVTDHACGSGDDQ
jgi:hypothetical protein